jgi:molecular chaperone DnaK
MAGPQKPPDDGKRQHTRHAFAGIIRIDVGSAAEFLEAHAKNISTGGMFIQSTQPLPIGNAVEITVRTAEGETFFTAKGEVVWIRRKDEGIPGMGVRFTDLPPASAEIVERIVAVNPPDEDLAFEAPDTIDVAAEGELPPEEPKKEIIGRMEIAKVAGPPPILGIDLGTTFSCAAIVRNRKVEIIPAKGGQRTMPSVVSIIGGKTEVGWSAYERLATHPKNTIFGVKRLLARRFRTKAVQDALQYYGCDIVQDEQGDAAVKIEGKVYSPTVISAQILTSIKQAADQYLGTPVNHAVISVPAYYNDRQRQAVIAAGKLAGLEVRKIVNEPTAAAVAYGVDRGFQQLILVYDFGGGTFDVSVLELQGNVFEVLSTGGDPYLGGADIDNRIVDHVIAETQKKHNVNLSGDANVRLELRRLAEAAKRDLSEAKEARIILPNLNVGGRQITVDVALPRETLNKLTMELVDRTLQICDKTLLEARRSRHDIDEVVFVGGQTRMPLIQGKVQSFSGKQPRKGVHPDEAVAIGAALLASRVDQIDPVMLKDVVSMSIGIALPGGRFKAVVEKNTRLPVERSWTIATTKDDQTEVELDVYQGEHETVDKADYLGTIAIANLPPKPKKTVSVQIQFRVDTQGFLTISAQDNITKKIQVVSMVTRDTTEQMKELVGVKGAVHKKTRDGQPPGRPPSKSQAAGGGLFGFIRKMLRL